MTRIYPSLMAADQLNLEKWVDALKPYCAGFHVDIMDNHFVPNITWGAGTVNALAQKLNCCMWVHLLVDNSQAVFETLSLPVGSLVSFHIESVSDVLSFVKIIKEKNHIPSIAISPKTPVTDIFSFLDMVDHVLLMSVEPGFSGQPFCVDVLEKLDELVAYRQSHAMIFRIGMDGGINKTNIETIIARGVNDCAIAGGIFYEEDPVAALRGLKVMMGE
jgi:ribulose-phosphate 3-epimerase